MTSEYKVTSIMLLLVIGMMQKPLNAAEIVVSPNGADDQAGTAAAPLRSLQAAQQAARKLKASGIDAITVTVRGGKYYLDRPLVFTSDDSGTAQTPIVWQAAEGEKVTLSGGRRLQLKWKPFRDGILSAAVPKGLTTDQLFVDGERQQMARYPNFDQSVAIFNGYAPDCLSPERVARWGNPAGGFFHAMHPGQWGGFSYLITGKDASGQITYEGGWQGNRADKPHAKLRFVENIFEELDAPGEWFLDNAAGTLYVYPPEGTDLEQATVEAVSLRHLVEFRGNAQAPVRGVTLRGFTLERTARTFMETREPLLRSDWTIYRGGAVVFDGVEDCSLVNCIIDQVGGNAVFVNNYNRRVRIDGCRIERSGAGGVMFVGDPKAVRSPLFEYHQRQTIEKIDRTPGPLTDNYPADCVVSDCLITQVGRVEKQSTGIGIDMAARITVRHCSIYDMPRAGINVGDGCWGGHVIEFCDIFDTVKETGDHGSFNSWGRDRFWLPDVREVDALVAANPDLPLLDVLEPIVLRNNRWRCDHGWDIDLDDGSSNYQIYNNLCLYGGIKNREGYRRKVENNVLVGNGFHPHVWFANSGDVFARNIVWATYKPARMRPGMWGDELDHNLLHDEKVTGVTPASELQKVSGKDEHSLKGNALFIDPARGDFRVRDDSPALKIGFRNFTMDQFGVISPALRKLARKPSFSLERERQSKRDPTVRDWRGVSVRNVVSLGEQSANGLPSEAGVIILEVPANHPLAKGGLRTGDVILKVGDVSIDDVSGLLQNTPASSLPKWVTIFRDQRALVLDLNSF